MKTVTFIGAGNMAFAMANAINNEMRDTQIGIKDISEERITLFKNSFKLVKEFTTYKELIEISDIIVIAVKPQVIDAVLTELGSCNKVMISIAAGKTMDYLKSRIPNGRFARVMPNTPSLVGQMAAGVSFSEEINSDERIQILNLLSCSGLAIEVEDSDMDAVTGVSGSGPAFAARIMEKFIKAGVNAGLAPEVARDLTLHTFLGTAKLLLDKEMDIEELIKMVSSPGGTTIAGRGVLENSDLEKIVDDTVQATILRSKELGSLC